MFRVCPYILRIHNSMPNYKNTLIKTTTVPILELTDELQRRTNENRDI